MAGESPDRSKQHESSAEPTSGSGAAVPEPVRAGGDPRLAVAGEKARLDQATAVFSTRALRGSAGTAVDEAAAADSEDAAEKGTGGDARQSASLASWVRTAEKDESAERDEDADEADSADGSEAGAGGAADDVENEAGAEAEDDGSGDVRDEASGRSGGTPSRQEESEDSAKPGESVDAEGEDSGAPAAGEGGASEPGTGTGDGSDAGAREDSSDEAPSEGPTATDSGPKVVDAEAETGTDAEDEEAPESEDADGSDSEAADGSKAATAGVDQPTAVFKTRRPAVDQPTTMLKLGGVVKPSGKAAAGPSGKVAAGPSDKGAAEPSDKAAAGPSDKAVAGSDDAEDGRPGGASAAGSAVDQPTTMLKLGGVVKPSGKAAAKPSGKAAAGPSDKGAAEPSDKAAAGPSGKAAAGPADRAPRKPAPTWAAKPSAPAEDKADTAKAGKQAPEAPARDESAAERTSKFVALKPLDEPKPAQQRPGSIPADATAALPRVGPERTAQQPLPPKPPLDLLAELTNTPPPPETPVRTIVRRVKIWTPLLVLLVIIFAIVQAVRPLPAASLTMTADDTYTFGGKFGLPWPGQGQSAIEVDGVGMIGTEGVQSPKPIASVAKIMTAYVTLHEHPLKGNAGGPAITVDQQAADESRNQDESTAAMQKGQKFSERQMLQMLLIPSGNNAARLLARWDSDNKTFVGKMNAAAKKLGMTKTTYTDPSGLESTTVSTAVDQLKLAKAAMQDPVFRSIVRMAQANIPGLDKTIINNNDLLVQQVGVIGLKTGSSTPAGGNLVWAATKVVDGKTQTIYGAVLNQDAHQGIVWKSLQLALSNSRNLINKIQQGLVTATVVKKGQVVGYVDDQLGGRTPVVATQTLKAVGWPGLKTRLSIGDGGLTMPHEAKAGKTVGYLTVGDGSSRSVRIPVALQKDLTEPGYGAKFTRLG